MDIRKSEVDYHRMANKLIVSTLNLGLINVMA